MHLWFFVCKVDFPICFHLYQVGSKSVGGSGIVVSKIAEGGPAAKAGGLRVHDRIMKVNVKSTLNKSLTLTVISIDRGHLVDIGRMS